MIDLVIIDHNKLFVISCVEIISEIAGLTC